MWLWHYLVLHVVCPALLPLDYWDVLADQVVGEGLAGWNISHLTRVIVTTMLVGAEGKALNNLKIYVLRILSVKEKIKAYQYLS